MIEVTSEGILRRDSGITSRGLLNLGGMLGGLGFVGLAGPGSVHFHSLRARGQPEGGGGGGGMGLRVLIVQIESKAVRRCNSVA